MIRGFFFLLLHLTQYGCHGTKVEGNLTTKEKCFYYVPIGLLSLNRFYLLFLSCFGDYFISMVCLMYYFTALILSARFDVFLARSYNMMMMKKASNPQDRSLMSKCNAVDYSLCMWLCIFDRGLAFSFSINGIRRDEETKVLRKYCLKEKGLNIWHLLFSLCGSSNHIFFIHSFFYFMHQKMMHFRLCLFVCVRAETLIVSSIIHPFSVVKVVKLFVVQSFTATAKQKKKNIL